MLHPCLFPSRRAFDCPRLGSFAISLVLAATLLAAPVARATTEAAPPAYPDAAHVLNGCYLSTVAYIARFSAEFPDEQAAPLAVVMVNADGQKRPHTITLLTWKGRWWGRDEYFGVFALNIAVESASATQEIGPEAERMLQRHAARYIKTVGRVHATAAAGGTMTHKQRVTEIAKAASLLPFATEQFWVRSGHQDIPFLFFRPATGKIAVYDPVSGTASAECAMTDGAEVVAAVAARLGYKADSVARYPIAMTAP